MGGHDHDWARSVDRTNLEPVRGDPERYAAGGLRHLVLEVLAYAEDEAQLLTEADPALEVCGALTDREVDDLHGAAFDHDPTGVPWREQLERHSLFWLTARVDGELVGFVNVVGDGGAHAILLDTCVDPARQGLGIGAALVAGAADEASRRGCRWLHADYAPEHADFYERTCGLRPTPAGLLDLS